MPTNRKIPAGTYLKIGIGAVIVVAASAGAVFLLSRHPASYSTAAVTRRDLTETVRETGTVQPVQDVSLTFNIQGQVSATYVDVGSPTHAGEVLAALDTSDIQAGLAGAEADIAAAQADLGTLTSGARPEELAGYQQKYADASSALVIAMKNAYLESQDAVTNKADELFTDGQSANPIIAIYTQSLLQRQTIDEERLAAGSTLAAWESALAGLDPATTSESAIDAARLTTQSSLSSIKSYLDDLNTVTGALTPGDSGMTQAQIQADTATVNGAGQEVAGAAAAEEAADAAWGSARDALTLELAGSTADSISAGQAAVAKAQAEAAGYQSQLAHAEIVAPFAGTVTAMNFKVGEVFVPGITADEDIELQSLGQTKIEVYVPETDVGKISVGAPADITLDAYGPSQIFPGTVTEIDPAATVQNGVSAYKVTLAFDDPSDARIKLGMTANTDIVIASSSDALAVPESAIIADATGTFVLRQDPSTGAFVRTPVQTGITSDDGYAEVASGLSEGDQVATFGAAASPTASQ